MDRIRTSELKVETINSGKFSISGLSNRANKSLNWNAKRRERKRNSYNYASTGRCENWMDGWKNITYGIHIQFCLRPVFIRFSFISMIQMNGYCKVKRTSKRGRRGQCNSLLLLFGERINSVYISRMNIYILLLYPAAEIVFHDMTFGSNLEGYVAGFVASEVC